MKTMRFPRRFTLRKASLTASILLCSMPLWAQVFGGNPNRIKWRQTKSETAQVIYPKGLDSVAARVAGITSQLATKSIGIDHRHDRIPIVLQQHSTFSNAYVGLGPWRSEFFMTPPANPFDLGSQDWMSNLAIHEYRHVQQFSNYNVGITKAAGIVFGQLGRGLLTVGAVPDWFFEGDAVWSETVHSTLGRGRLPAFFNEFKSINAAGRHYHWMKWRNGSLKDLVPNHYPLGYQLATYGRLTYGDEIWNAITNDAARYKGLFYPWQKAINRQAGVDYKTFRDSALSSFSHQWRHDRQAIAEPDWITSTEKNNVVDYKYPYPASSGSIVALKRSYRDIPRIVRIRADGTEERLTVRDIDQDDYFSYRNERLVYTLFKPNARYGNEMFSNLVIHDLASGKRQTIGTKGKYFSPDINSDGSLLVAVHADNEEPATLRILDSNGNQLAEGTMDKTLFYSHPKFLEEGKRVVVAARYPDGTMAWLQWSWEQQEWKMLTKAQRAVIGFPVVMDGLLYYSASNKTNDALFVLNLTTLEVQQAAQYHTGIYQGFVREKEVIGSYFTNTGHRIGKTAFINNQSVKPEIANLYVGDHLNRNIITAVDTSHQEEHYHKTNKLFNFHSLIPNVSESDLSLTLIGENVLNTLLSNLSYTYNTNESSHRLGYTGVYGQWFLQPVLGVSQTWNRTVRLNEDTTLRYNEFNISGGLRLPLNLTGGKQSRSLVVQSTYNYEQIKWQGIAKNIARNNDFHFLDTRISYSGFIQQARQHIFPRWGQQASLTFQNSLSSREAYQVLARASLFLPGFAKTHNLVLQTAWQARDTMLNYLYTNNFPFARGYTSRNFPRMWRLSANYHFPLFYPDWGFANLVYFRRIRANVFADHTGTKSLRTGIIRNFNSAGTEIYADCRFWNQVNISFGVRYSRLLDGDLRDPSVNQWEFILPINLFSL